MHQPLVEQLVWMRILGDVIFSIGAVALIWFVMRLWIAPPHEAAGCPADGGLTEEVGRILQSLSMIEFYPQIKLVHVSAVIASGTLFLLRGLAVQLGSTRAMAAPLRY